MKTIIFKIKEYLNRKRVRRQLRRIISVLASVVVFSTTYALLLPALTLESKVVCGKEEHEHTQECYTDVLICGQEESDGHQHTDECYNEAGELVCGQEESEGHHHDASCYESQLTCGKEVHIHTKDCYAQEEPEEEVVDQPEEEYVEPEVETGESGEEADAADEAGDASAQDSGDDDSDDSGTDAITNSQQGSEASADNEEAADADLHVQKEKAEGETAEIAEPEKLKGIELRKFLSDYTTIYYHPEGTGQYVWEPVDPNVREQEGYSPREIYLEPDDEILLHIAYDLPAGTINETNAETEYELPLLLEMSSDEIKDNNENLYRIFNGTDRESDDLTESGTYEIKEKRNGSGDVTDRWLTIHWNEYATERCGGRKLTDGTVTIEPSREEGFLELRTTAKTLLTLDEKHEGECDYELFWGKENNKNNDLSTTFLFDADAVKKMEEKEGEGAADQAEDAADQAKDAADADDVSGKDGAEDAAGKDGAEEADVADVANKDGEEDADATDMANKDGEEDADAVTKEGTENAADETGKEGAEAVDADGKDSTADDKDVVAAADAADHEERYAYRIERDVDISISEIFDELRVTDEESGTILTAADVQEIVSSNDELIIVTHKTKILGLFGQEDWLIKGIRPFTSEEMLTVTLKDGRVIRIAVTEVDMVTNVITADGETYKVSISYDSVSGIPDDATLDVKEIAEDSEEYAAYMEDVQAALEAGKKVQTAKLFDITILDGEGNKIEPATPVRVNIEFVPVEVPEGTNVELYHFKEEDEAPQVMENVELQQDEDNSVSGLEFETDGFSVYGVVYTVDFHWEVDGKEYEFGIPGGGYVSLQQLVEVLGISGNADTNLSEIESAENGNDAEESLTLDEVSVSDTAREFVSDITNVEFSKPELVWTGKVDKETTVGNLKEKNQLDVQYSEKLSEEQIEEINAQTVEAGDWALISVQPFTSEETLTVTMKDGGVFTIRVTDAQIRKDFITASGETYEIIVTYGEDAQIPDDAKLNVKEILSTEEEYVGLYNNAAAQACGDAVQQGIETPIVSGARLFDIEILGEDGPVEPSAPVEVNIRLLGAAAADLTSVVHFAENDTEVSTEVLASQVSEIARPEPLKKTDASNADNSEAVLDEKHITQISFRADSFSVYTVVNVTDMSSIVSSGSKFALVTGIAGDPGATTGYSETWGQDYFTIIVNAHAMTDQYIRDDQNRVDGLQVEPVHAYEDGSISYVGGNPVQWQFESDGNGKYYLSANGKYLQRFNKGDSYNPQYGWEARLVDNKNQATPLSVTVNSDGTILIYDDRGSGQQYYLHNDGSGEWNTRVFKFRNQDVDTSSQAYRFRLCQESDQFDSFAARKTSVQDLTVNDSFLIYRKFEDSKGNEQLYALASDGTFVRVYDGGDTVYWRETNKNLYWNYRLEGNYYSIYSTNPVTGETVYINPMHSSAPPQTITSEPSRLTLIGKDNGEYGTAIENWDQTAYDYAGLHVTVNGQGEASLSTGTRVAGTSDEFLFAIAGSMPGGTAETVDTVDSDSLGIKITMFDYGQAKGSYNAGDKLSEMTAVAGSAEYTPHAAHALVKSYLESGLPSSTTNGAMTGLFTGTGSAVTAYKENVNHLFLQSYYDENGMFRYRSEDNYAYLPYNADTQTITGTDFTVYRQAATPYPEDVSPGHTYYTHGHFMPYNDIDMNQRVSRLMNQYGNEYHDGQAVGELPVGDGRTYEDIYGVQGIPNFYTGMKLEASFTQPNKGKMENGDPMVFKFTGDDDMWVYIDGVLVLDIGGIHEPLSGTIDFSTGKVNNPTGSSLAGEKTLYDIFMAVRDAGGTPQNVKDKINSLTWVDVNSDGRPDTFADYSNHDFKAFYMERGAGASNLDIQFNLKVTLTDEFVVEKQISDGVDPRFINHEYRFQATYKDSKDNNAVKPLFAGAKNKNGDTVCTKVYYKDRRDEDGRPIEVSVPVDDDGYFTLKAGEAAVFKMADEAIEYTVKEVKINSDETQQVEMNGQVVTVTDGTAEAAYARVTDRSRLNYKNHPYLQNLKITKHLLPQGTQAAAGDVFEFRVYLESTVEVDGQPMQQLVPYSYGPYYVTKLDENDGKIHYYTLTGENNAPVDKGTKPVVCSTTGRSGSINSIPPEYTVVVPNLAVGTHFYIEERRDNIPAGYVFDHEDLIGGTYDTQTLGTTEDIISRILARDEKDHQVFDPDTIGKIKKGVDAESEIFNRKVYVNVQKQWLKTNGEPYTIDQARQLPGSTNAVVTAELWKKKTSQDGSGETETQVTVTFMVNTTAESEYRQVSVPVTVKKNSTLEFSLGANKTSQAQEIHTEPAVSISRSSVSSNPKIQYSNGRQKEKWSKYTISDIAANTIVYATFDAEKVSDDFVGLYIASMEEPGSSELPVEEKVADVTLNNENSWLEQFPMESGYTYFLMNVAETGLDGHAHEYTFIDTPAVSTDENGNLTLAVANKYREPINITVEKVWSPALTSEQERDAFVKIELHRYAKKTKGILTVVLKDNYGAPIEGAVFKLYKDGVEQVQEYVTDVNGKVAANDLEPGTYRFKQISTPEGYSMSDSAPQTDDFVVEDNKTDRQERHFELSNQALETNGVATLTLLDNKGDPIQGAKYNLIKKEGNRDVVIKEGLVTDESGKITVAQLKAGTYYFFETEPPEDYNLPDAWQDTDFIVLEHPGAVQYFDISMTNNLKGKGYVEITLNGPEGLIDGSMFELYKDNEKLAEGTTGSNGQLTFGNPERLPAGTYYVKQVSTNDNLLPANQQSFTIQDNGDVNQKKELTFTNPYRGMGSATVTLTRKDDNSPISGAKFELYKDGELLMDKTTNADGQLTFGDPDKLPAGNYSIKQVSTTEGLDPVVNNWPFVILENGDPNQTKFWNVQNEENAGNVTIKLWRKGGRYDQWNWNDLVTIDNLKPGQTYWFTAELKPNMYPYNIWYFESEVDNLKETIPPQNIQLLDPNGWDSTSNKYHFSITPQNDNMTYSYALVTSWGVNDILSMSMDESSRQTAASTSNYSQSTEAGKLAALKARVLESAGYSMEMTADAQNDSMTAADDNAKDSIETQTLKGTALRDANVDVNPSGPPSSDYIVDSGFVEEYTITKADNNWKHVFENLDKSDQGENPYYYYVVETECVPDSYHVVSYENDNLSETGTITITNEVKPGALTIEKHVTVNGGAVPQDVQTIADGDYTFSVIGPNEYSQTVTVTVSQGQTGSTELNNLTPGKYTITETGTTNKNGVNLITEPIEVVVAPESSASTNTASFTNDLETTNITFAKDWSVNGKENTEVTYSLFQVAEPTTGGDPIYDNVYVGSCTVGGQPKTGTSSDPITFTVTKNSPVTVSYLPKAGVIGTTSVNYKYYALEQEIDGFAPNSPDAIAEGTFTITNTPIPASATFRHVQVEKEWKGNQADQIGGYRFKLTQERAELSTSETQGSGAFHPITIRTVNGDGTSQDIVYYVAAGKQIRIKVTRLKANAGTCTYTSGSTKYTYSDTATVDTGAPLGGFVRVFRLTSGHTWGTDWSISATGASSASDVSSDPKTFIDKLSGLSYSSTYDGQLVLRVNVPTASTATVDGGAYTATAENWKATVQNLPYYYYDSAARKYYTYRYRVEELSIIKEDGSELEAVVNNEAGIGGESNHFTVSYDNSSNPLKITNTLKNKVTLSIIKVDATDMEKPLGKAQFTLKKLDPEGHGTYMTGPDAVEKVSEETDETTGKTEISEIGDGYYEISESKVPSGYIQTGEGKFYIQVSGSLIKLLAKDETKPVSQWQERTLTDEDKLQFDAQTNTAKVGNTPGAALPEAGGPGTTMLYMIGLMAVISAGAGMMMRKRRDNAA